MDNFSKFVLSIKISPEFGLISPNKSLANVVLPEPLLPFMIFICCATNSKLRLRKIKFLLFV